VEAKEGLDLADDLPAGAIRMEDLIEKAKESAADRIDAIPAAGALVGLGEELRREQRGEEGIQVREALLAEGLDAAAQGSQALAQLWKEGSMHGTV
jgi:hypothetical protein